MKNMKFAFMMVIFSLTIFTTYGQPIDHKNKQAAIEQLNQMMIDYYVFPDVAEKTASHLNAQLENGHFDQSKNYGDFADQLTEAVQSINKDKHMRIWPNEPFSAPDDSPERVIEEMLFARKRNRNRNDGFYAVEMLEGNVGYLDLRGFSGSDRARRLTDSYMEILSQSDAIIIDLRKNGGGDPDLVQYLCSYFFDKKIHLNTLYYRHNDQTIDFWVLDEVNGEKMPDIPLFVITSNRTFSGAEEFAYNMQTQKRATLIGETSGGGANPGGSRPIHDSLSVFIPTGRAINPITKTNWEGVGVIPEIKTSKEEALEKTIPLARKAAEEYRKKKNKEYTKLFLELSKSLQSYEKMTSEKRILANITRCVDGKLLSESDINNLGYEYLIMKKKPKIAKAIFEANVKIFPESANAYDSYAESLIETGDLKAAVKNYQKAVDVGRKTDHYDLQLFEENLKKAKERLK